MPRWETGGVFMRVRLHILLTVLALVIMGAWVVWTAIENGRDSHDLWHNPARHREWEEHLIKRGIAKRGPDGNLVPGPALKPAESNSDTTHGYLQ